MCTRSPPATHPGAQAGRTAPSPLLRVADVSSGSCRLSPPLPASIFRPPARWRQVPRVYARLERNFQTGNFKFWKFLAAGAPRGPGPAAVGIPRKLKENSIAFQTEIRRARPQASAICTRPQASAICTRHFSDARSEVNLLISWTQMDPSVVLTECHSTGLGTDI